MATGFINPGDLATAAGTPTGFTTRWGTGISVVDNVSALYGKDLEVLGDNPNLFSIDALNGAADVEVVMLLRVGGAGLDNRLGVWARVPDATAEGSKSGYLGNLFRSTVPDNRIQIAEYNSGSYAGTADENTNNWVNSTKYWVRFRVNSTNLQLRFWADGDAEPGTWTIAGTDATYATSGWTGLGWNGSASSVGFYVEALGWATAGDTAPTEDAGSPIATPTGFTFTAAAAARQLDGSWDAVAEAATYDWVVEQDVNSAWSAFQSGNTASTSFQLTDADGVDWARTYRGRVRAVPA